MAEARTLIVLSGGHPYEAGPFEDLLASLEGWRVTHHVHPEAEQAVAEGALREADAILFYDMPGYRFAAGKASVRPPSFTYRRAITEYFARGGGAVAMHHALAGWADWPEWAEMLGGRFLYEPGYVHGERHLDSGYRHAVHYEAHILAADHPVTAGLPSRFPLCDELYLAPVWGAATPLLRADHAFVRDNFYSSAQAVAGQMFSNEDWDHRPEGDVIVWEKPVGAGRLVYIQPGDGPSAYEDPHLRRLLANALAFVSA